MSLAYPYAVNIDWLQLFCHDGNISDLDITYNGRSLFEFRKMPYGTRHYSQLWEVINSDGDKYATIQRKPHSSILSADSAIIQLANRELYKSCYASEFILFLHAHKFKYKSISRLDICFDSNNLRNGLLHSTFIKRIMQGVYLKNNQAKVKWHFDAMANVGKPMECNSCSFGSQSSPVSSKMYNKTLELKEVKNKPYIVESWYTNGLNINKDVWRIELSIKSDATTTVRTSTGEIFRLSPDGLSMQKNVEDIFFSYAAKYFSFKRNDGTKNKSRMKEVEIFPRERTLTIRPVRITNECDSTRSDRIFLKKLHGLFENLPNMDYTTWSALWEVSNAFTLSRSLSEWRKRKLLCEENIDSGQRVYEETLLERLKSTFRELSDLYPKESETLYKVEQKLITLIALSEYETKCI